LSTLGQPYPEPAWKQEVSRRIAEHKHRKGAPAQKAQTQPHQLGNSRAAEAAARVAKRLGRVVTVTSVLYSEKQRCAA